jgi:hypothetical protein
MEFARLDDGEPSANPFAAALGIAGIAAFIALLFLVWPIFASLVRLARYGFDCAIFLFNATHAIRWLGEPTFDPYAKVSIAFMGVIICIFACRSLSRARSAIVTFARRTRA